WHATISSAAPTSPRRSVPGEPLSSTTALRRSRKRSTRSSSATTTCTSRLSPPRAARFTQRTTPAMGVRWRQTPKSPGGASGSPQGAMASAAIAARDRITPVPPESTSADAHAGRRLPPLVFVALHQVEYSADRRAVEAACLDLIDRQVLLDEGLEDRVEYFVGWQRVAVLLAGTQLFGRLTTDYARRIDTAQPTSGLRQ